MVLLHYLLNLKEKDKHLIPFFGLLVHRKWQRTWEKEFDAGKRKEGRIKECQSFNPLVVGETCKSYHIHVVFHLFLNHRSQVPSFTHFRWKEKGKMREWRQYVLMVAFRNNKAVQKGYSHDILTEVYTHLHIEDSIYSPCFVEECPTDQQGGMVVHSSKLLDISQTQHSCTSLTEKTRYLSIIIVMTTYNFQWCKKFLP